MNKIFINAFWTRAALLWSCFFFAACENDPKVIEEWTRNEAMVEEAKKIQVYLSESSRMRAKLTAPYMLRYSSDTVYVEFPRTLHVDFFDSTAQVESRLDSRYGKYFESLNKVYLRDSVIVFNIHGDTLQTQELWWDQNTQRFFTEKPVRIRRAGSLFFGVGMDARQDLSDIHIREITNSLVVVPDSLNAE